MPRINNTFVPRGSVYSQGSKQDILDLRYGGQFGWSPDLTTYVNNHPFTSRNAIVLMLEEPKFMRNFQNSEKWIGALRALFENKAKRVEGLNFRWDVSVEDVEVTGGGGQVHQVFTDVKEAKHDLTFVWQELYGMPIFRIMKSWINYGMMNPHAKYAMMNTIPGAELEDLLPDQYGATLAVIEPDPNHRYVNQGTIITNVWPTTTGDNTIKRDKNSANETREVSIPFTGYAMNDEGINDFLQELLTGINIHHADPTKRRSFIREISGRLAAQNFGYANSVERVVQERANV